MPKGHCLNYAIKKYHVEAFSFFQSKMEAKLNQENPVIYVTRAQIEVLDIDTSYIYRFLKGHGHIHIHVLVSKRCIEHEHRT